MHEDDVLVEEELKQDENLQAEEAVEAEAPEESAEESTSETETEETSEEESKQDENLQEEEAVEAETPEESAEEPTSETEAEEPSEEENAPQKESNASQEKSETVQTELPYHERYYLKYKEGKRSTAQDLDGTKAFLQQLGFDGGELRQARQNKDISAFLQHVGKEKNNQQRCSYCGTEISGVEFQRLPDGRMRCTTCSSTVVKTKQEVEQLCQRVIDNMDSFFGATIDVPISIEVVDERKLKKKVGIPLGTRDEQSMLILGVAINKKKKYSIILENGAPRISLIATFAHELTHIWQYTHWDNKKNFKKCPKSKRLLIYEGMAKWAEIQYLYLIGETNVAKREEYITRNRQDEYGFGFCLYEDQYPLVREAMSCEDTPFTPDRYPFD